MSVKIDKEQQNELRVRRSTLVGAAAGFPWECMDDLVGRQLPSFCGPLAEAWACMRHAEHWHNAEMAHALRVPGSRRYQQASEDQTPAMPPKQETSTIRSPIEPYRPILRSVDPKLEASVIKIIGKHARFKGDALRSAKSTVLLCHKRRAGFADLGHIWDQEYPIHVDAVEALDPQDVRAFLSNDPQLSHAYTVAITAGIVGYHFTQFVLKGHCTPKHVDFHQLKIDIFRAQDDDLRKMYASGEGGVLVSLAEFMTSVLVANRKSPFRKDLDPIV